jgi:general secretion pathway protein I
MSSLRLRSLNRGRQSSRGFTLLEVMLAFVIFALSFATVLEIMAGSMRSVRRASDDTEVALFAQSIMDLVGTEIPVEEGEYSGTGMDRYEWQLFLTLYDSGGDDREGVNAEDVNAEDVNAEGDNAEGDNAKGMSTEGVSTEELAELSGIELYRVDLDVDWETGRRHRAFHFSTIRSVLADRQ